MSVWQCIHSNGSEAVKGRLPVSIPRRHSRRIDRVLRARGELKRVPAEEHAWLPIVSNDCRTGKTPHLHGAVRTRLSTAPRCLSFAFTGTALLVMSSPSPVFPNRPSVGGASHASVARDSTSIAARMLDVLISTTQGSRGPHLAFFCYCPCRGQSGLSCKFVVRLSFDRYLSHAQAFRTSRCAETQARPSRSFNNIGVGLFLETPVIVSRSPANPLRFL